MEKNGNTLAPGDTVFQAVSGQKVAASRQGKVSTVDTDQEIVLVKWADTGGQNWVPLRELIRE